MKKELLCNGVISFLEKCRLLCEFPDQKSIPGMHGRAGSYASDQPLVLDAYLA